MMILSGNSSAGRAQPCQRDTIDNMVNCPPKPPIIESLMNKGLDWK